MKVLFFFLFIVCCQAQIGIRNPVILATSRITSGAFIRDDFNRADANPMSTTASDGVSTWTSGNGAFGDAKILTGTLKGAVGTEGGCVLASPTVSADQYMEGTFGGTGANCLNAGLMLRVQPGLCSGYTAVADSATTLKIYKIVDNGTGEGSTHIAYTLKTNITVTSLAGGEVLKFTAVGTTLSAYINGTLITFVTDSTYSTGQIGHYFFGTGGAYTLVTGGGFQ